MLRIQELMQRDIDDDRVKNEIVPYLRIPASHTSARFFPPVLVALVPHADQKLLERYPKPALTSKGGFPRVEDKQEELFYEEREYGSAFSVRIPLTDEHAVLETDAMFHGTELRWNRDTLHLLVLDGQHRLVALKAALGLLSEEELARGYEKSKLTEDELSRLSFSSLPITIIFPPMLWEGNSAADGLSLVSIFREVFVDVNKNAKPVSIARNILLNERDLISIFAREVIQGCVTESSLPKNKVLTSGIPLYSFEWEPLEGTELKILDTRAISSVAVLKQCLDRMFLRSDDDQDTFRTMLEAEEGDKSLDPTIKKQSGIMIPALSTTSFARWQRNELVDRFKRKWMPSIMHLLRNLYPAEDLIAETENKRLALAHQYGRNPLNQVPKHALEFLLGTRSDQQQIRLIARSKSQRIGRFDPHSCALAEKEISREFFSKQLRELRSGPFPRIFFSNVGQAQLFEFVFWTLRQNAVEGTQVLTFVERFVEAFNEAFATDNGNDRLFSNEAEWNQPVIDRLGTQEHRQKHIAALLKLSLCFVNKDGTFARLFKNYGTVRDSLCEQAFTAVRENLILRFRSKFRYLPKIQEIANVTERDKVLERDSSKAAEKALSKLDRFLSPERKEN